MSDMFEKVTIEKETKVLHSWWSDLINVSELDTLCYLQSGIQAMHN